MTIIEAINRVDTLFQNTYSQEDKVQWLSRVDWMVKRHILDNHDGETAAFSGYTPETDLETVLLIPEPYDEAYIRWLEAQIAYTNGEYKKYNNAITNFNTAFDAYKAFYIRTHKPVSHGSRFLF